MRLPNVTVYSLQKQNGEEQIKALSADAPLIVFDDLDSEHGLFIDTAALIPHLDLVLTVDTSIAHLAGALGARTWVLLPFVAEWRWMEGREDSPWYPTMRLFRQTEMGTWDAVIERVCQEITTLIGEKVL
jgi:ADP-heptose:LPS heptosyltransferase